MWFGDVVAPTVTLVSETEAQTVVPAQSAGTVDVAVITADGQEVILADAYTLAPPPVLTSLAPASAAAAGGQLVTLQGASFVVGAAVRAVQGDITRRQ